MPSPSLPPFLRRPGLALTLVALAIAGLAWGARGVSALAAWLTLPTGTAEWIWVERDWRDVSPEAFYAVRDFALEKPPARARLLVVADEEYLLSLNGRPVGAGRYLPGAAVDAYEVGPLLQPGLNRLLAEVRSGRGPGGLLASLEDPESGRQLVLTDRRWRIVRRFELGLARGWLPLEGPLAVPSEPAYVWGHPPIGRWGRPRTGAPTPLLGEILRGRPEPPAAARRVRLALRPPDRPQPPQRLFDWGREVAGFLILELQPSEEPRTALLFTGNRPPDVLSVPPTGGILLIRGESRWMDVQPRRFRYALVVGLRGRVKARVQPVDPAALDRYPQRPAAHPGVLGIAPPPLRTPVEDEVWRKLEGVARIGGRKKR